METTVEEATRMVLRESLTKKALEINPALLGAGAGGVVGAAMPAENNKNRIMQALMGAGAGGLGGMALRNATPDLFKPTPAQGPGMIQQLNDAMTGRGQG